MTFEQAQPRLVAQQKTLEQPGSRLRRLAYFNQAYIVMTNNLLEALRRDRFEHPKLVEDLLEDFAERYFAAVEAGLAGEPMPPPWRRAAWRLPWPAYANILLGARAHILYDLPLSLKVTINPDFRSDFDAVNSIVLNSAEDVLKELAQQYRLPKLLARLPALYRPLLLNTLSRWREKAWRKFLVE